MLCGNGVDLVVQGTESRIEPFSLHVVADLTTQLGNDVALSIDLVLKLTFLKIAEFLRNKRVLAGDGVKD